MDVGLEETSLCVVDSEGNGAGGEDRTEPAAIRSALEGYADRLIGRRRSVSLGIWLYRELQAAAVPIMLWKRAICGVAVDDAQQNRPNEPAALRR